MDQNVNTTVEHGPLVSYIMCVKNGEHHTAEAIQSVLDQTYRNLELIIIDDASTDRTPALIQEWADKDDRIHILTNPKSLLPPGARNVGIARARGEYIAILDADDVALPERTSIQVSYLQKHPEIAAICGHAEIIDGTGKLIGTKHKSVHMDDVRFAHLLQNQFIHSTLMIRRKIFDELGGFRDEFPFAEDYDLTSRLLQKFNMTNIDHVLVRFRVIPTSATGNSASSKIQRASSLAVTARNIAPYITASPEQILALTDTLNGKKVSLGSALSSLKLYRQLTAAYIAKNSLAPTIASRIQTVCQLKVRAVYIQLIKRALFMA